MRVLPLAIKPVKYMLLGMGLR